MFSDQNGIKPETNNRNTKEKSLNIWKLINALINSHRSKRKSKKNALKRIKIKIEHSKICGTHSQYSEGN